MGDSYRDELATTRKKAQKSGTTRGNGDRKAREARSKAIQRQQSLAALRAYPWVQVKMRMDG